MRAQLQLARASRLLAPACAGLAAALLVLRFRQWMGEALETPVLANVLAISAGLAVASVILVRVRLRGGERGLRRHE